MTIVTITRSIEFDAGHRIPNHKSKCRHLHGHRYRLEASITGEVIIEPGRADEGMVADFGDLKDTMLEVVGEPWDHAFLCYEQDMLAEVLQSIEGHSRTILLPFVPTAENLAAHAFNLIDASLPESGFKLTLVRLYETPNCWADAYRQTS